MMNKPFVEIGAGVAPITITGNPVIDRVYQNRGITHPDQINHTLSNLLSPFTMKGVIEASDVIIKHILKQNRILVVGDYDCDGATATSVAVEGLYMLGAEDVRFIVPDRQIHGYGLSPPVVALAGEYKPDLIITVDNGIASIDGANAIHNLDHPCELVITDHHLAPKDGVPRAAAIVNPQQPGCQFESKAIAGCGVIFYLIIGLRARMREKGIFKELGIEPPRIEKLLDLVALGTVADVVPLDYNNRCLVTAGLDMINRGEGRPGINALLEIAGRKIGQITSMDMGFVVGPRLNAAGRLDDMTHGIRLLLERDVNRAGEMGKLLDDFNKRRKEMQKEMVVEANEDLALVGDVKGIVLYKYDWHEGLVGLISSNVKEKTNRPVISMTDTHGAAEVKHRIELATTDEERQSLQEELLKSLIKGSARSVPGVHIKHVLDSISHEHPDVLNPQKYGGHAMAAGLSVETQALPRFRTLFHEEVSKHLTDEMILGTCEIDALDMPESWINIQNADMLSKAGPWGAQFQEPLFGGNFQVMSFRVLKEKHLKLTVKQKGGSKEFDAICFNCIDNEKFNGEDLNNIKEIQCTYSLSINEWKGKSNVQLMVRHLQLPGNDLEKQMRAEYANKVAASPKTEGVKLTGIQKRITTELEHS